MKGRKLVFFILLIAYALIMVLLLFFIGRTQRNFSDISLVPFETTKKFFGLLRSDIFKDRWFAAKNLAGNILMFIPLGFLPPMIWKSMRKPWICLPVCAAVILLIETVQYFTRLGTADIDDLMLNMIGAGAGFAIAILILKREERKNGSSLNKKQRTRGADIAKQIR